MTTHPIDYKRDAPLTLDQFTALYRNSTLAERRPADDPDVMRQMMENASLTITAWAGDDLGPGCMLVLLAAPAANDFYPKIGFEHNPRAWVLKP